MNREEVTKRRQWQNEVYNKLKQVSNTREIEVLGKRLTVLPDMFAPLWGDSLLLAKCTKKEVKSNDVVLDFGTGTGIQGIFAAEKAKKVISVDVNPRAVECAKLNAKKNGLDNKIEVRESDIFSNVKEKFDLIVFNPPFRWFKPRDMLERGEVDEGYATLQTFFKEVRKHLNQQGRVLLVFSDSGDLKLVEKLIKIHNFNSAIIDTESKDDWKYIVYKIW